MKRQPLSPRYFSLCAVALAACAAVPGNEIITQAQLPTITLPVASETPALAETAAPDFTPTPLACWQEGGQMTLDSLRSEMLPLPLEFRVYTPPCYAEQPDRSYPVLYLIHGQTFNDDQWDRLGADEVADRLIGNQELAPFLIVMPRDRVWTEPAEDMFGEAVISDLIPYIDTTYRTMADREYRAIGGLSRGASWAMHLGFGYWELFGAVGGHSLPVFWTDASKLSRRLDEIPSEEMPRIFVDIGRRDQQAILQSTLWFVDLLNEKGIPHEWYLYNGYHEEAYWMEHVEQYMRFYAAGW
jgi:enterochelin esterase-like enzyme